MALELQGGRVFLQGGDIGGGKSPAPCLWLKPPQRRGTQARCLMAALGLPNSVYLKPSLSQGHAAAAAASGKKKDEKEEEDKRREPITAEKLDEWTRESIREIVSNIGEAPFLVHIFSGGGGSRDVRLERESASQETWPHMKKRWRQGSRTPDGVILVEELKDEEGADQEEASAATCSGDPDPIGPRTWGLVVQGRGMDCVACYILSTSRVRSSVGFCTHFCLVRAQCCGDPAALQLKNAWLQGR